MIRVLDKVLTASALGVLVTLAPLLAHAQAEPPLEPLPAAADAPAESVPAPPAPVAPPEPAAPAPVVPEPRDAPAPYVATPAPAPPARFGSRGQLLVTSAAGLGISSTSFSETSATRFAALFAPSLDTFVLRNVSLGFEAIVGYEQTSAGEGRSYRKVGTSSFGAAFRLGFLVPLSQRVSWYPRLSFGAVGRNVSRESGEPSDADFSTDSDGRGVGLLAVHAPLVLEAAPHLVIGFGPGISQQIGEDSYTSVFGQLLVGTYWGGTAGTVGTAEPTSPPAPRFGRAGQVVISGETQASVTYTASDDRGYEHATNVTLSPGVDIFVLDHLSLGAGVSFASTFGEDNYSLTTDVRIGGGPRVGLDLPLGERLSFYPRLSGQIDRVIAETEDAVSLGGSTSRVRRSLATTFQVRLFAPVLLHVASHGFVGFGPYAARELVRSYDHGNSGNVGTEIGASLIVGGWL